jgi:hypothetical protein
MIKGRSQVRPEPEEIEGETEYEIERILSSGVCTTRCEVGGRYKSFKSLYFPVKWKGYPDDESTWELRVSLAHATESMEELNGRNPEAPTLMT